MEANGGKEPEVFLEKFTSDKLAEGCHFPPIVFEDALLDAQGLRNNVFGWKREMLVTAPRHPFRCPTVSHTYMHTYIHTYINELFIPGEVAFTTIRSICF